MATNNAVNTSLSGQTGTGSFVGGTSPTITGITTNQITFQSNGQLIKSADGFGCAAFFNGGGTSVNQIGFAGSATGVQPQIFMSGTDTDVGLKNLMKGAGVFTIASTSSSPISILSGTGYQHGTFMTFPNTAATRTYTWPDATGTIALTAGSGGLKSFQIFTSGSAATYTTPAGITSILIEVVGGGGGGGGGTGGASTVSAGAGGGSGGYARLWVASAAASYTYTVGAAGTAGTSGGGAGGTGGTTTFSASSLQATGGTGGSGMGAISNTIGSTAIAGVGGIGSNGDVNSGGAPGIFGVAAFGSAAPGAGGSSIYGGGGGTTGVAAGTAGRNYGSAGSGALVVGSNLAGGAGSAGVIIVWEFA